MPAYNPPPQVLFSPVTNYYQGKAIRAQQAMAEKQLEMVDKNYDLKKRQVEVQEGRLEFDAEKLLAESIRKLGEQRTERLATAAGELAYNLDAGVDPVAAQEQYFEGISEVIGKPEMEQMRTQWDKDGDGVLNEQEVGMIKSFATVAGTYEEGDPTKLTPRNFINEQGVPTAGFANTITGENISTSDYPIAPQAGQGDIGDPRTNSQRGAAYQQNVDEYNVSSDVQEMITSALPQIIELPGAVGIKGTIGLGGAGVLSSLGQEEMANAFSQYMSGASPEEIAQIQTQLQAIRGRIIPIVTGEQGKRLSETEREIASKAVGLIESIKGPADLSKAYPQVLGAMRQLYAESWATKYRLASHDENINYPYDLSSKDQRIELFTEFSEAGVDIDTAKRTVVRLKAIQGVE